MQVLPHTRKLLSKVVLLGCIGRALQLLAQYAATVTQRNRGGRRSASGVQCGGDTPRCQRLATAPSPVQKAINSALAALLGTCMKVDGYEQLREGSRLASDS